MENTYTGLEEKSATSKPISCVISVYPFCMFKCKMCLIWAMDHQNVQPLAFESIKNFIKSLSEFTDKKIFVDLVGGEPLMRSDIIDLIKVSSSCGLATALCTNGYLLDMDMAKLLFDSGLNRLSISLDSLNEHRHDAIRGKTGSYNRIMNALGYLSKFTSEKFKVNIQTTIMHDNIKDIVELASWVQNNAVLCSIYYIAVTQPSFSNMETGWYKLPAYQGLWPQDISEVNASLDELIRLKTQGGYFKIANSIAQLKAFKIYFENPERFVKKTVCGIGDYAINIKYNGDATFCAKLGDIGNIYQDDVKNMWHSERALRLRREMKQCTRNCHFLINCYKLETNDGSELIA